MKMIRKFAPVVFDIVCLFFLGILSFGLIFGAVVFNHWFLYLIGGCFGFAFLCCLWEVGAGIRQHLDIWSKQKD